ncbi:heat shock protein HspQ [Acuticoccus sediminis]|uniref:Heat shock protein HspQ n=1 Tax=Acuticoccus sediminis TaxID=2184697 RepID=A0A8B2NIM2_9HYPH|nr:heat shock protein HspQ [Acuticoccus sediminis]RAH99235.1 heat shock protein HspQ [Acuticoccus sediminis]
MVVKSAKFNIGQAVRHRVYDFGGLVVDVDAIYSDNEETYKALPKAGRPDRNQPFYRVRVDYEGVESMAYVSEENLLADELGVYTRIDASAGPDDDGMLLSLMN